MLVNCLACKHFSQCSASAPKRDDREREAFTLEDAVASRQDATASAWPRSKDRISRLSIPKI